MNQAQAEDLHAEHEEKVYERVRALLRKAESTDYPHEAEAFTAKAQELLTRYALDIARVAANSATQPVPVVRRIPVTGTYASGRVVLLGAVADSNDCRVVWDSAGKLALITGFATDIEATQLLWHSLMIQAERAITESGSSTDGRGVNRTKSFRSSFWMSFASRIGKRLAQQRAATEAEADADLLPVLASRAAQVGDLFAQEFPSVRARSLRPSSRGGWAAGRRAADAANLAPRHQLG